MEYNVDECDHITTGKNAGLPFITIHVGSGSEIYTFCIDFSANIQISSNGYRRRIRQRHSTDLAFGSSDNPPVPTDVTITLTASRRDKIIHDVLRESSRGVHGNDDECVVCMETFNAKNQSFRLPQCGLHFYHESCVTSLLKIMGKCGVCCRHYVVLQGNQPKEGVMTHRVCHSNHNHIQGYPSSVKTIIITYTFPAGIQGPEHPNPGVRHSGTTRHAYLPDTREGREVLGLLQRAFDQRLVFTIGTSITTGVHNSIIWNGIHHKAIIS